MAQHNEAGMGEARRQRGRVRHMGARSCSGAKRGPGRHCLDPGVRCACGEGTECLLQRKKALEEELARIDARLVSQ